MKEILLAIIIPQILLVPVYFAIRRKAKEEEGAAVSDEVGRRVFEILRMVYLDMNRQRVAAVGPWIAAALEHRCVDPAVALTAVRWTLRDIQKQPVGEGTGYISGIGFRFDLSTMEAAERELEEIKEGRA